MNGSVELVSPLPAADGQDPVVLLDIHILHTHNHHEALMPDPVEDINAPPLEEHPPLRHHRRRPDDDDDSDDPSMQPPASRRRMAISELINLVSGSSDSESEHSATSQPPPRQQCDPTPGCNHMPISSYSRYSFEEGFALLMDAFDHRDDLEFWAVQNAERVTCVADEVPALSKPGTVILLDIPRNATQGLALMDQWGVFKDQTPGSGKGPDPRHPDRPDFYCHRRMFIHKYNKQFRRTLWWLSQRDSYGAIRFSGLALLQYSGEVNYSELQPHGNSKKPSSVHNRLHPNIQQSAQDQLATTVPTAFLRENPNLEISYCQVRTLRRKALNEKKQRFV